MTSERREDGPLTEEQKLLLQEFAAALYGEFGNGDDSDHITRAEFRTWIKDWLDAARVATPEPRENGWEGWVYSKCNVKGHPHEEHWHPPVWQTPALAAARGEPPDVERLARALSTEMDKGLTWFYMGHVQGDLTLDDWRNCAEAIAAEYAALQEPVR